MFLGAVGTAGLTALAGCSFSVGDTGDGASTPSPAQSGQLGGSGGGSGLGSSTLRASLQFTAGKASGYGQYRLQPNANYRPGDTVWVYVGINGLSFDQYADGSAEISVRADIDVRDAGGQVMYGGTMADTVQRFGPEIDPNNVYVTQELRTPLDAAAGHYPTTVTVTDKRTGDRTTVSGAFSLGEVIGTVSGDAEDPSENPGTESGGEPADSQPDADSPPDVVPEYLSVSHRGCRQVPGGPPDDTCWGGDPSGFTGAPNLKVGDTLYFYWEVTGLSYNNVGNGRQVDFSLRMRIWDTWDTSNATPIVDRMIHDGPNVGADSDFWDSVTISTDGWAPSEDYTIGFSLIDNHTDAWATSTSGFELSA